MGSTNPLMQISTEALYEYKNPLLAGNIREAFAEFDETKNEDRLAERLEAIAKTFFNIKLKMVFSDTRAPGFISHEQLTDMSLIRYNAKRLSDSEHTKGLGVSAIAKETAGWITKDLKVGGVFADLQCTITMGRKFIDGAADGTEDDRGVMYLHEIGHFLDYVQLCCRQFTYYGVVDSLVRGVRGADTNKAAISFVEQTGGKYGFKVTDVEDLKGMDTDDAMRAKLLSDIKASSPEMLYGTKTAVNAEYDADELPAAIFGPKNAALAFSKALKMANHPAYSSSARFYGPQLVLFAGTLLGSLIASPVAIAFAMNFALTDIARSQGLTHPDPLQRLQRFRTLLLSDAKSSECTREQATRIANDLKVIDAEIAQLNLSNKSFNDWIMDMMSRQRSAHKATVVYESLVNELQNNTLYLRAAQLRTLKD